MGRNLTNTYKASINILGSCVIREALSSHENDGGYKVFRYVNLFSPLSLCEEAVSIDEDKYNNCDFSDYVSNFRKKCILFDMKRSSIDYISSKKTDWLIIDCALFRRNLYQLGEKKLTCFAEAEDFLVFLSKQKIIPPIVGEICLEDISDDELLRKIHYYVDKILEIYSVDKIILLENKNAYISYNESREIDTFLNVDELTKEDKRMLRCFKLLKSMLKGCHIIPVPDNLVADDKHKLGRAPVHYTQEYYDYILQAINCICEENNINIERESAVIDKLCRECEILLMEKYYPLVLHSYITLKNRYSHGKLRNLYRSFKDLYNKYIKKEHKFY